MAIIEQPDDQAPWPRRGLLAVLEFATASHARAVTFLLVVCLAAFLPGFWNTPPIDRDEARFAQATKQMLETGDYVDIRFQHDVRYKKPVGIYWLQAGAVKLGEKLGVPEARTKIWLYRIPSLIGAIGAVLLTYWTALAFGSRRTAYLAALMLACSVLLSVEARLAKTDAALLLTVVAAMGALARLYLPACKPADARQYVIPAFIFWTALAAGALLKGPLILMVAGLAMATLIVRDRSAAWLPRLRPAPGLVWFIVLVAPWFLAIAARSGESFFVQSVGRDLLAKAVTGQESHGAPPGYYAVLFWATFWPAAPLVLTAAPAIWAERREAGNQFLLAWAVPSWIVFEVALTKLPHYVLPLYPAIAILIAQCIERHALSTNRHLARATVGWPIFAALLPGASIAALVAMRWHLGAIAWPFAAAGFIFSFWAWRLYKADGAEHSILRASMAAILVYVAVLGAVVPLMRPLFPSVVLARILGAAECEGPRAAAAGFHEPSLVFLAGTSTILTDGAGAAAFLSGGECRYAFVENRHERAFATRAAALGIRYRLVSHVQGININGMRPLSIAVYRSQAGS